MLAVCSLVGEGHRHMAMAEKIDTCTSICICEMHSCALQIPIGGCVLVRGVGKPGGLVAECPGCMA